MNLIGLWPAKIRQDSVDHLARVLARRTGQEVVPWRIGRYFYVYIAGDLNVAREHFQMVSPRYT
jgi:hypothetical protein